MLFMIMMRSVYNSDRCRGRTFRIYRFSWKHFAFVCWLRKSGLGQSALLQLQRARYRELGGQTWNHLLVVNRESLTFRLLRFCFVWEPSDNLVLVVS